MTMIGCGVLRDEIRSSLRTGVVLTLVSATALGVAACGGDDGEEESNTQAKTSTLAVKLSGAGKDLSFGLPDSVPGGVVRIEFVNATKGEATAQLVRVDAGHTAREGLKAAGKWADGGGALPPWVQTAGGLGFVDGGTTTSATQSLAPGKYFVLDIESETIGTFEVTQAEDGATLPAVEPTITATEYAFETTGLKAGTNAVLFDNKGREPHVIGAAPIKPGKTIEDVREYAKTEKGEDPTEQDGTFETAILDGGVAQVVDLDFKRRGKYVLLCYVPDRAGGPPHLVKGMISEGVVD